MDPSEEKGSAGAGGKRVRTLRALRRRRKCGPDASYDIDGDGIVSIEDMKVARKLNTGKLSQADKEMGRIMLAEDALLRTSISNNELKERAQSMALRPDFHRLLERQKQKAITVTTYIVCSGTRAAA